jgi:hypothetical protein
MGSSGIVAGGAGKLTGFDVQPVTNSISSTGIHSGNIILLSRIACFLIHCRLAALFFLPSLIARLFEGDGLVSIDLCQLLIVTPVLHLPGHSSSAGHKNQDQNRQAGQPLHRRHACTF